MFTPTHAQAAHRRHRDRRPSNEIRTYRERRISVSGRQQPLDFGPGAALHSCARQCSQAPGYVALPAPSAQ